MFAADAPIFLADTGEEVTWTSSVTGAALSGLMLFDRPDADMEAGSIISREYEVTFETAAWPGLKRDEVLVIGVAGDGAGNGGSYKLRTDPRQFEDGVFCKAMLSKLA